MAISSLSLTFVSKPLTNKENPIYSYTKFCCFCKLLGLRSETSPAECAAFSFNGVTKCSRNISSDEDKTQCTVSGICKRRALILGIGALAVNSFRASPLLAEGKPPNYEVFVNKTDGCSYYYPSDWREFDFRGHDSAFKDRYSQLQNVRLSFIPTNKTDIHDMGPMEELLNI
ncbi:hypothetical protein CDL12_14899 [Handroanthus impetiginosus]|uniref:PsbP C-terminal domain-containing protein n=1 Tax=Handroanthus impetiginosus TaxID=429701 RepID=A0A2G9H4Q0_9LAMI|nr:hypothetical protein CDL12_14899 [Handroanthus impetiginosus]